MKFFKSKKKKIYFPLFLKYLLAFLFFLLVVNLVVFVINKQKENTKNSFSQTQEKQLRSSQFQEMFFFLKQVGNSVIVSHEAKKILKKNKLWTKETSEKLKNLIENTFFGQYLNLYNRNSKTSAAIPNVNFNQSVKALPFVYKKSDWILNEVYFKNKSTLNADFLLNWQKSFQKHFNIDDFDAFFKIKETLEKIKNFSKIALNLNKFDLDTYLKVDDNESFILVIDTFFKFIKKINKKLLSFLENIWSLWKDDKPIKKIPDALFDTFFNLISILNLHDFVLNQKEDKAKYRNLLILLKTAFKDNVLLNSKKKCEEYFNKGQNSESEKLKTEKKCDFYQEVQKKTLVDIKNDEKWLLDKMNEKPLTDLRNEIHRLNSYQLFENFFRKVNPANDLPDFLKDVFDEQKRKEFLQKIKNLPFIQENLVVFQVIFLDYLIFNRSKLPINFNESLYELLIFLINFNFNEDTIFFNSLQDAFNQKIKQNDNSENSFTKLLVNFAKKVFGTGFFQNVLSDFVQNFQKKIFLKSTTSIERFLKLFLPKITFSELNDLFNKDSIQELKEDWREIVTFINENLSFLLQLENENVDPTKKQTKTLFLKKDETLIQLIQLKKNGNGKKISLICPDKTIFEFEVEKTKYKELNTSQKKQWSQCFSLSSKIKPIEDNVPPLNKREWNKFMITSHVKKLEVRIKENISQETRKTLILLNIWNKLIPFLIKFVNNFNFQLSIFKNWNFILFSLFQSLYSLGLIKDRDIDVEIFKNFNNFIENQNFPLVINKIFKLVEKFFQTLSKAIITLPDVYKIILNGEIKNIKPEVIKNSFYILFYIFGYVGSQKQKDENEILRKKPSSLIQDSFLKQLLEILNPSYFAPKTKNNEFWNQFLKQKIINKDNIFENLIKTLDKYLEENFYFYLNSKNWQYENISSDNFALFMKKKIKSIKINYDAVFKTNHIPFRFKFTWQVSWSPENKHVFKLLSVEKS